MYLFLFKLFSTIIYLFIIFIINFVLVLSLLNGTCLHGP